MIINHCDDYSSYNVYNFRPAATRTEISNFRYMPRHVNYRCEGRLAKNTVRQFNNSEQKMRSISKEERLLATSGDYGRINLVWPMISRCRSLDANCDQVVTRCPTKQSNEVECKCEAEEITISLSPVSVSFTPRVDKTLCNKIG